MKLLRHLPTALEYLFTVTLIILAAVFWARSTYFSLPTPLLAHILSVLAPLLNHAGVGAYIQQQQSSSGAIALPTSTATSSSSGSSLATLFWPLLSLLTDTVLLTLSSSSLNSEFLNCALHSRWLSLFEQKASDQIRRIQNGLRCCGLRSTRDMAWPFPDRSHGADTCATTFGRDSPCITGWLKVERGVLGVMIAIAGSCFVFKVSVVLVGRYRPEWLRREEAQSFSTRRRSTRHLIESGTTESDLADAIRRDPYTDDPEAGEASENRQPRVVTT